MTRSLIRLDNTVRTSLNDDCMTNSHDERQWDDNNDAMTETDSDITRDDRDEIVITKGYESISRSYRREREGVGTIGLDWLGIRWREGSLVVGRMVVGLVPLVWPSPPLSPHSSLSNSLSSPPSTSI